MARLRPPAIVAALIAAVLPAVYILRPVTLDTPPTAIGNKATRDLSSLSLKHPHLAQRNGSSNSTAFNELITYSSSEWDGKTTSQCHLSSSQCTNMRNDAGVKDGCALNEVRVGYVACEPAEHKPIELGTAICCPIMAAPNYCIWRGGEQQHSKVCNGQCHEGEMTLFSNQWGGLATAVDMGTLKSCPKDENKVFCCRSDHWDTFIHQGCHQTDCDVDECPADYDTVGTWWAEECTTRKKTGLFGLDTKTTYYSKSLCCPAPSKIIDCRWSGLQNDCRNSECHPDEFEAVQSINGPWVDAECPFGSHRALCCKGVKEPPFLPVDKVDLWPKIPPEGYNANFHIEALRHTDDPVGSIRPNTLGGFGWIILDGPPEVLAIAKHKRDGSPSSIEFLDCHEAQGEHRQAVRFVCTSANSYEDCDHLTDHGLEGKVIHMPDSCGAGKYVVAHRIDISVDQSLPEHLSHISNKTVMDLTFDYDFGLMKRDAGEITFRVDFDNMGGEHGEWEEVVKAPPITQRDLLMKEFWKRFWSPIPGPWREKFTSFRNKVGAAYTRWTYLGHEYDKVLLHESKECSEGVRADVDIRASGKIQGKVQVWSTLFGALSPETRIDHGNVFVKSDVDASMQLNVSIAGGLVTEWMVAELFDEKNLHRFYHPGLLSIQPSMTASVSLKVDADMDANYTSYVRVFTRDADPILQSWPYDFFEPTGDTDFAAPEDAFGGVIDAVRDDSIVQVDLKASVGFHIVLNGTDGQALKRDTPYAGQNFDLVVGGAVFGSNAFTARVGTDGGGDFNNTLTVHPARGEMIALNGLRAIDRLNTGPESSYDLGYTQSRTLGRGTFMSEAEADYGKIRPWPISGPFQKTLFKATELFCGGQDNSVCSDSETISCDFDPCTVFAGSCQSEDYEQPPAPGSDDEDDSELVGRSDGGGSPRDFTIYTARGTYGFTITSKAYPTSGKLFEGRNGKPVLRSAFDYAAIADCGNFEVKMTSLTDDQYRKLNTLKYATEHIIELQTIPTFINSIITRRLPSGDRWTPSRGLTYEWFEKNWNTEFQSLKEQPKVGGGNLRPGSPNGRIFEAIGSKTNRQHLVLTHQDINLVKSAVWSGNDPRAQNLFDTHLEDWVEKCLPPERFLSDIRAARAVFSYIDGQTEVRNRFKAVSEDIRVQLQYIQQNVPGGEGLSIAWERFMLDFTQQMKKQARGWMDDRISQARTALIKRKSRKPLDNRNQVEELLDKLQDSIPDIDAPGNTGTR